MNLFRRVKESLKLFLSRADSTKSGAKGISVVFKKVRNINKRKE
jgi:hypothetical protein